MRKLISVIREGESGVTAIFIAICMVVILGFAAVVIDAAGQGFNERRQDQSAADVGALAAVQFAVPTNLGNGCSGSVAAIAACNGAHEAIEVANATLDSSSSADWSDSSRCGTPPAGFTATSVSACVAFNSNLQRAWVRIPTIDRETFIAGVIGFDEVSATADAIAGAGINPPGGVLPFLLPGSAASANYECLKAFPNPNWGPCEDAPISGNFGSADFYMYGNADTGWTQNCSGDTNGRLVANIARGVDHPLSTHPTGSGSGVEERPNCPVFSAQPNIVDSQTGVGSNLEQGLLYGGSSYSPSSYPGKIQVGSGGYVVRNSGGSTPTAQVDNTPLWTHLIDDSADPSLAGTPCDDDDIASATDAVKPGLMDSCLTWAKGNSRVIFTNGLRNSIRFGWVPLIWQNTFSGNPYYIAEFRPVYLDTTWFSCSATDCTMMHTPGIADSAATCPTSPPETRITCGTPGAHNRGLNAVTSWILDPDIVPDNAKTPSPGSVNQRTFSLVD